PEWSVTESDSSVSLNAPDGSAVSIECRRLEENTPIDLHAAADIPARFPSSSNVQMKAPRDGTYKSLAFEGFQQIKPVKKRGWLSDLVGRSSRRKWQLWLMQHRSLLLSIECRVAEAGDEAVLTDLGVLVGSLTFAVEPADTPEQFATRVMALAREKFPLLSC